MIFTTQRPSTLSGMAAGSSGSANLPALLVASTILLIAVGGAVSTHMFGLRMMRVVDANRGADKPTLVAVQNLESEIRTAKQVQVGSGSGSQFSQIGEDAAQVGNALQIYPTDDSRVFIRYYRDDKSQSLNRIASGERTPISVIANVSNSDVFGIEDHTGKVLTNVPSSIIIRTRLNFSKIATTGTDVGTGKPYNSYEIKSQIAFSSW